MILTLLTTAFATPPVDIVLRGVCDGSAAVLAPNARLLVAYDEDRSLHLYGAHGGDRLATRDLAGVLGLERDNELDLEGATADSNTIWWVGSHGTNKHGEKRPNRHSLFATSVPRQPDLSDLKLIQPRTDLLPVLVSAMPKVLTRDVLQRPPKKGGLNVEGLAMQKGGLVVGLRSPLTAPDGMSGRAHIVRLKHKGKAFEVQSVQEVDLGDRGVRSLVWTGTDYLIIAGHVNRKPGFQLYRWDGAGPNPTPIDAPLAGLNNEALINLGSGRWAVLSDDGAVKRVDWKGGGDGMSDCKDIRADNPQGVDHPSVYARGRLFTLP